MTRQTTRGDATALPLVEIGRACEILHAHRQTVDEWIRAKELQAFTLPASSRRKGGKRYLVLAEVEAKARERGFAPGTETGG